MERFSKGRSLAHERSCSDEGVRRQWKRTGKLGKRPEIVFVLVFSVQEGSQWGSAALAVGGVKKTKADFFLQHFGGLTEFPALLVVTCPLCAVSAAETKDLNIFFPRLGSGAGRGWAAPGHEPTGCFTAQAPHLDVSQPCPW